MVIEEILFINGWHREKYEDLDITLRTHDRISVSPLGFICLLVLVGPKDFDASFIIILESDLFQVRLGIPYIFFMNGVTSMVHKCLNCIHEIFVHVVHDTGYKRLVSCPGFALDHFWLALFIPLPPRGDFLYKAYIKYKIGASMLKVSYQMSPYVAFMKASMIA